MEVTTQALVYKLEHDLQSVLFPEIKSQAEGILEVSGGHKLWYAEYGNPKGIPVIVMHGGPGFGCSPRDMRFFDANAYRIVLLDQRGAGKSQPSAHHLDGASMEENTTQHLIADFERLRERLGIDKWVVFGGSWGSALAIAYGEAHPDRCLGFILRGVMLGTKAEWQQVWHMNDLLPDAWHELNMFLPKEERDDLFESYYRRIHNPDRAVHLPAALSFMTYDLKAAFAFGTNLMSALLKDEKTALNLARLFTHYCKHDFFLDENQTLSKLGTINHLPLFIVHGRYDAICRPANAWRLAQLWPNAHLTFVQDAGHSAAEPGIAKALVSATEQMKTRLK